ncbi:MAG: hypothetical protein ACXW4P_04090 [Thermoanaerobaculia bacterium]
MTDVVEPKLVGEWLALLGDSDRALQFYFEHILPTVVHHLEHLPEHATLRARGCSILVSTMGFSPETTVIAASVFRPRRLIVIATEMNESVLDMAIHFLERHGIMKFAAVRVEDVDPTNTKQIYDSIRRHIPVGHDGSPIMDVTGGKKIMSATAAVAAWELRIPLCYVEGPYSRTLRRPMPGTERIILLTNPSQEQARMLRDRALQWYERGSMPMAIDAFRESRDAQTEAPHLDELALQLARCESALMDLDFEALGEQVESLDKLLARPSMQPFTQDLPLVPHARALRRAAGGDHLALLATFRQLVTRYCAQGRFDFASLLAYRTLEELVEIGLSRVSRTGVFDMSDPDLALLTGDVSALRQRYADLAAELGHNHEEIPGKVTFLAGLMLLGLTTDLASRLRSVPDLAKTLRHASGLAAMRNHSVLAHGRRNLTERDVEKLCAFDRELARAVLGDDATAVEHFERDLVPPVIRQLVR